MKETGIEDLRGDICMFSYALVKFKKYNDELIEDLQKDIEKLIVKARLLEELDIRRSKFMEYENLKKEIDTEEYEELNKELQSYYYWNANRGLFILGSNK